MANNPKVFLDIAVSFKTVGRIEIELFADTNPVTAENFRALCTGEKGIGKSGIPLHYKGSIIHGIIPDRIWFGGDITHGNGFGGESIYGHQCPKEGCSRNHDREGILSMGNSVGKPNRSQFMLHLKESSGYDNGDHIVFGQVLAGLDVISRVGKMAGNEFVYPSKPVTIADCGQILTDGSVSTMVGYSTCIPDFSTPVYLQKLLDQLRDAQLKIAKIETAMAKETFAYDKGYVIANPMSAVVMSSLYGTRK